MTTLLDKDEMERILQNLAIDAIDEARIGNRSGQLRNTLRVLDTPQGFVLEFEPYGLYLDAGVKGVKGGFSGKGYDGNFFRFSGQYKMIGGNLGGNSARGYAIRTAIYNKGLAAKPWIDKALQYITEGGAELIEQQVVQNIEINVEANFPSTQVNINL
jgi:hypothetical protein